MGVGTTVLSLGGMTLLGVFISRLAVNKKRRRMEALLDIPFPPQVARRLFQKYPHFSTAQRDEIIRGLRTYFQLIERSGAIKHRFVLGMPSRAVDEAWHAFILETRAYAAFCQAAFGKMLHHTGFSDGSSEAFEALYNTWAWAQHLPGAHEANGAAVALFTLDQRLEVPNAFVVNLEQLKARFAERKAKTGTGTSSSGGGGGCGLACAEGGSDSSSDSGSDGGSNGGDGGGCGGGGD